MAATLQAEETQRVGTVARVAVHAKLLEIYAKRHDVSICVVSPPMPLNSPAAKARRALHMETGRELEQATACISQAVSHLTAPCAKDPHTAKASAATAWLCVQYLALNPSSRIEKNRSVLLTLT
jgi:hypothetical protein